MQQLLSVSRNLLMVMARGQLERTWELIGAPATPAGDVVRGHQLSLSVHGFLEATGHSHHPGTLLDACSDRAVLGLSGAPARLTSFQLTHMVCRPTLSSEVSADALLGWQMLGGTQINCPFQWPLPGTVVAMGLPALSNMCDAAVSPGSRP